MDVNIYKTTWETLGRSKNILLALGEQPSFDALGAALALAQILEKQNKKVSVVTSDFTLPKTLKFLPDINRIESAITKLQRFVISLDTSQTKVDELTYTVEGDLLKIFLTPKTGGFSAEQVKTALAEYRYDLTVTIEAPKYTALGAMFKKHPDFFYHTPVIAIDKNPAHEMYGNVNLINLAAAAISEIIFELAKTSGNFFLSPDVATFILLGLITETKSFKSATTTPRTLEIAAELVAAGGRRGDIVDNIYRTRSLNTLQLWGRALARLKHDPQLKLSWSVLTKQDFILAGATDENLGDVLEELLTNSKDTDLGLILYEQEVGVCALLTAGAHHNVLNLALGLDPIGSYRSVKICLLQVTLLEAEKKVLEVIRKNFK